MKEDVPKQVKASNAEGKAGKKEEELIRMDEKVGNMEEVSKETEI